MFSPREARRYLIRAGRLIAETIYKTAELCYSYDRTRGMVRRVERSDYVDTGE